MPTMRITKMINRELRALYNLATRKIDKILQDDKELTVETLKDLQTLMKIKDLTKRSIEDYGLNTGKQKDN